MKKLFLLALFSGLGYGHHPRYPVESPVVVVIAANPVFGTIWEPTLADAEEVAKILTSTNPICVPLPEVCEAQYLETTYTIIHENGTVQTIP